MRRLIAFVVLTISISVTVIMANVFATIDTKYPYHSPQSQLILVSIVKAPYLGVSRKV